MIERRKKNGSSIALNQVVDKPEDENNSVGRLRGTNGYRKQREQPSVKFK